MRWVPTVLDHLREIDLRSEQISEDIRPMFPDEIDEGAAMLLAECSRTLLLPNGQPAAAFGVVQVGLGVMATWGAVGEKALHHRLELARGARFWLTQIPLVFGCHRVQATVKSDSGILAEWMEFLEMKREGRMRQYGADRSDYDLYARIFP